MEKIITQLEKLKLEDSIKRVIGSLVYFTNKTRGFNNKKAMWLFYGEVIFFIAISIMLVWIILVIICL